MAAIVAAICGVYGLLIGSFLNVLIWRVPRHESIVKPASHCPGCDAPIAVRDNIPVSSWLLLRGKCRHCDERISFRYPFIELLTGVLFFAVGLVYYDSWVLPAYLFLTAGLVALSAIDLELYILPNRIVYPLGIGMVPLLALASLLEHDWEAGWKALAGGAAAFAFFFIIHLIAPRGMGYGDVRLSFILGLSLGWLGGEYVFGGLFFGFLYGAIVGIGVIAVEGRAGRKRAVPFGPFLAAGTLTWILWGSEILHWYHGLNRA
jgi:leader peptidase (prepilin peptidase) / N-methyltransferase